MITKIFSAGIFILIAITNNAQDNRTPIEVAKSIANRVINETLFELKPTIQKPILDIQVLDFSSVFGEKSEGSAYAQSTIKSDTQTKTSYGVSYSTPIKIWVNDNLVFEEKNNHNFYFKEIAYNLFHFQDTIEVNLNKGINKILIKSVIRDTSSKIYLRELTEPEETTKYKFNNPLKEIPGKWLFTGNYNSASEDIFNYSFPPEKLFEQYYIYINQIYSWRIPADNILYDLIIKDDAVYKRESYAEWMYPNGTVLFGIDLLANYLGDNSYSSYVEKVCDFTLANYDLFEYQYFKKNGIRSSNHRLFRMSMLDDASAPALPFIERLLNNKDKKFKKIVDKVTEFVSLHQYRLTDGTFSRPEPRRMTVWADDLFMSVPYLVRAAQHYDENKYYDDAALQIINFNKYLFDKEKKLYKHAWFDFSKEKSVAYWGRANGWVIWGETEALLNLPKKHKKYKTVEKIFANHIEGIIKMQNRDGMWHQVLDRNDSFEETSCTAMFIIGIARGIKNSWISKSYEKNLLMAWNALKQRVSEDGIVKDITRGTGIGYDLEFYFNRERFDNDPRGLGAVITAAVEMQKYFDSRR
ncbi:MAG: glycoside hydrolase family 88 protein [Melioribacteraceae bacterium]|nr:glycoside hydrolase family 88 protein [Melioribacteraceae bacterium]